MSKDKRSQFQISQDNAKSALDAANEGISLLGVHSFYLHDSIKRIQGLFDNIRDFSDEEQQLYNEVKSLSNEWQKQVEHIKKDYNNTLQKGAVAEAVGAGVGVGVVTMGPTAAMGVATTFGVVASTGTEISTLSGAVATKAALAWLGGGSLASGGGGVAAGKALLALAGPVGWTIAGVSTIVCGVFIWKTIRDNRRLESVFTLIAERDQKKYALAKTDIDARILDMIKRTRELNDSAMVINTFGDKYSKMSKDQKYALGACLNNLMISVDLLTKPIPGLYPQYTETDLRLFEKRYKITLEHRDLYIALCNLLYGENISLSDKELKLLAKSFRKNEDFLETAKIDKSVITDNLFQTVGSMLMYKYGLIK